MKIFFLLVSLFTAYLCAGQQTELVDFLSVKAQIEPIASEEIVKGTVNYSFKILKNSDSIFLDAMDMKIKNTALEGVKVTASEKKIWLYGPFEAGRTYTAFFSYEASPKQTLYFTGEQIWTQGQGKYTSHWLPSIDDMNDKIEFDLSLIADPGKTVIANGTLLQVTPFESKNIWQFDMTLPMSSYLAAFAMGDFEKQTLYADSGIPIELYYNPEDAEKFEPTYRFTKEIFDFLEAEIGVPYPWMNYKEVPVRDFLYAGMENTTATIFSEAFVVDSIGYNDRNYVNVNAHELAHQWFGNLVTETEGTHHWLHEGFATYYALLAERKIFGEDYYHWKLLQSAEQLKELSDEGKGESLLNPKAGSLTFYEKGAWALHILKEQIGEEAFKSAVANYLQKFQFKNVTTEDFLAEVRLASGQDLRQFEADWLEQSAFKAEAAYESLVQSDFILDYFEVVALRPIQFEDKRRQLSTALTFPGDYKGQEAIYQLADAPISESLSLYKKGFESNNLYVRQAIAVSMETIPKELIEDYESLLDDDSYVTIEAALYTLWSNFPEKRAVYLEKTDGLVGFQDKNIRLLWLTLAMFTKDFRDSLKAEVYGPELHGYTSPEYSFEIRQRAFGYLNETSMWITASEKNLVNASVHPNWRFREEARKILKKLLTDEANKRKFVNMLPAFSEKEKNYLESILYKP
jgi:aminopeptidase N